MHCELEGRVLRANGLEEWPDFALLKHALKKPGPWIAGIDFPFGLPRIFIKNMGWPDSWADYVTHAGSLGRERFRSALDSYRRRRPYGDKEHRRATDKAASSISPQKLYGIPVALMFFEGAPRLVQSGVTIPVLQSGDPSRIVVEAYPGVLARQLIGRVGYKNDSAEKQTEKQHNARFAMLDCILNGQLEASYGLRVEAPKNLAEIRVATNWTRCYVRFRRRGLGRCESMAMGLHATWIRLRAGSLTPACYGTHYSDDLKAKTMGKAVLHKVRHGAA